MAAGTIQVTPVGVNPSRDIFNIIGEKVKKAKDQAIEARQEADERIGQLTEKITGNDYEDSDEGKEEKQQDIQEWQSLEQKRGEKGYFFKKALKFQATDKIRTTMGKFQRDPDLQNDPASTEKERFYAKSGMFRPGEMPDMSNREEKNKDVISYVGKGFQMIMDAIDKVKARVNRTAESTEQTSRTATSTENTTQKVSNATESVSNISNQEVKVQQMELNFVQDVEQKREQAQAEARSEQQVDTAGTSDVIETDQGVNPSGGILSSILNVGGELLSRGRFGRARRRFGNRIPGAGRARLGRMRAGRMMNPARRNRQYTAPIGPQPMNSPTPWAAEGGGFTPRMQSSSINLSDGGIIAPIKPKKQKKLSDGGITGLVSKFLPPPLGPMLNMMINPTGAIGGIGSSVGGAVGGAFQMLTNPTKLIGEGLRAVLPMNRNTGKNIVGGDKSEIENMTKIFQLPTLVGGGIMFASIAQIANAIPFLGAIINASKPIIKPILDAFGLPSSVLGMIFGGGSANAATMPVNFGGGGSGGGNDGNGNGDGGGGGGGGGGADLGASMRSGETIQAQGASESGGFIQGGSGKGSEGGQNTRAGYATHYHLSPPSNDANGWAQARAVALTSARMMLQRGSTVYFGNIKQYADPSKLEQQIAAEQKAHTQPGRTQGGIDMQEKSSDGNMKLKFPLKVTNVTQDISGGSGRTARVTGTNVRLAHGASGSANSIESSVAPRPSQSASAPSVNPDTSRSGSRSPGYGGGNGKPSTTLSNVANAARTANNIITNPVGAALSGLESFYPNFNR